MKTIKKLDKMSRKICFEAGYKQCKKDVLEVIDEMPYLDNDGNVIEFIEELKARIKG